MSGDGGVGVGGDRLGGAGQGYQHDGAGLGRAFDADRAAVVVDDLADDGEAEAGAVGFAGADEGVEDVIADGRRDAGALVDDANLEGVAATLHLDEDAVMAFRSGFTGIQEQIEKDALEFPGVEHAFDIAIGDHDYLAIAEFGANFHGVDGATQYLVEAGGDRGDGAPLVGEFAQGIDQIGHLIRGGLNFLVDLAACRA